MADFLRAAIWLAMTVTSPISLDFSWRSKFDCRMWTITGTVFWCVPKFEPSWNHNLDISSFNSLSWFLALVKFIISLLFKSYRITYRALYLHFWKCWIAPKIPVARRIKITTSVQFLYSFAIFNSYWTMTARWLHSKCTHLHFNSSKDAFFAHFLSLKRKLRRDTAYTSPSDFDQTWTNGWR